MKFTHVWSGVATLLLTGCQQVPQQSYQSQGPAEPPAGYYQTYASAPYPSYAPSAGIAPAAGPTTPPANEALAEVSKISERVQRVEKAMLRLDRRMQLVERNELNRMGAGESSSVIPQQEQQGLQSMNLGPAYNDGFSPVSAITSSLQAASFVNARVAEESTSASKGLPSLADPSPAAGRAPEGELAVWTVKYDLDKVWPERDQLPFSRDVVEALRNGQQVTVFARGKHPQAVEFRERVRALSRYLSKVASLETVPISAIPAPHLDDNTIEIFATH